MTNIHTIFNVILTVFIPTIILLTIVAGGVSLKYEHDCRILSSEYRVVLKELLQLEDEMNKILYRQELGVKEIPDEKEEIIQLPVINHIKPDMSYKEKQEILVEVKPKTKEELENNLQKMCAYINGMYSINKSTLASTMDEINRELGERVFTNQYTIISGRPYLNATGVRYIEELPTVESLRNDIITNSLHIVFRRNYITDFNPKIIPIRIDEYRKQVKEYKENQVV